MPTLQPQGAHAATLCVPRCPEGESQENPGSTKCVICQPGEYDPAAPTEDPVECLACPAGRYSDAARQLSCKPCAVDHTPLYAY